jgi:hypothetical protein
MKGSHLFWLSRSKGMPVEIWIRDYNPQMCFQKKISGRGEHNGNFCQHFIFMIFAKIKKKTNNRRNKI